MMLRSLFATLFALLFASVTAGTVSAASVLFDVELELEEQLRSADPDRDGAAIIGLAPNDRVLVTKGDMLLRALRQKLVRSEQTVRGFLATRACAITSLWRVDGVGATLPTHMVRTLKRLGAVAGLLPDGAQSPPPAPPDDGKPVDIAEGGHACAGDCGLLTHLEPVLASASTARDRSASLHTPSFPVPPQLSAHPLVRTVWARGPPSNAYPAVPGKAPEAKEAST